MKPSYGTESAPRPAASTSAADARVPVAGAANLELGTFEAMLAGISSRFVEAPLGEMDTAIYDALVAVSRFADVERSHVYMFDSDREAMNEIARWSALEYSTVLQPPQSIPRSSLPFYAEEVFSKREVVFAAIDEIPSTAAADREFLTRHGVRSALTIPLTSAGETIGTLTLATLTRCHAWSAMKIATLRVVADVIASALTRRRSEREQLESIRFERLITSLVSDFMNLPADELVEGVDLALETIARFVDSDRSALYIVDESEEFASLYRGWWAPGSAPVVKDYDRIDTSPGSPHGEWIRSESPHLILNSGAIAMMRPDVAAAIHEIGLGTVANLPLIIGDRRIGWFGVGAKLPRVSWSGAELRSLGLGAKAMANMYSRRQSESERRRHQSFDDALTQFAADFIKRPISEIRTGIVEIIDRFGMFAGSDRAAVLLFDESGATASTYHEWFARGEPAAVHDFPVSDAPWFFEQIMSSRGPLFTYPEEFPASDAPVARILEAIGIRTLLNCTIADGEHVYGIASVAYAEARHRPIAGTEQVLAVAAGIIANALSRERLEYRAQEQRDALFRAQRLGTIGQLAAGIAHELNQPLTAIANYSRACVRWLEGSEVDREAFVAVLERVAEEAIRAGDIIHNLRNHVKGGPSERTASSIHAIIDHACSLLIGTARARNVKIAIESEPSLPLVHVVPTEIGQVVLNVVQNAIDSIDEAGSSLRQVVINATRRGALVEVEISDTGPGFSDEQGKKLFDQFYSKKPGGLGLGLSISRFLVESNGGTMSAKSSAAGASIRFTLPISVSSRPPRRRRIKA